VKRSTTAILLKNLPYESDESELREMCERFGSVARFVLPSTRTLVGRGRCRLTRCNPC